MKILEPLKIKNIEIKNRMVVTAMVTNYCHEDGLATEKFIAYHQKKAEGGYGLIITEDYAIAPGVGGFKRLPGLWNDEQIASHSELCRRVHQYGAKIIAQIYHAGRETTSLVTGKQIVGPSAIKEPTMPETPRELTVAEILEIENQFAQSALRAKKAGFDGVEVHGAHGYLVGSFMSGYSNCRSDEYGGTIYNRARFAIEIIKKIRELCGDDFIIFFRISAQEYVDGGLTVQESRAMAILLEEAGVDVINVSQGNYSSGFAMTPSSSTPFAAFVDNAKAIKEVVSIPVIALGRINDPYIAESILKANKADLCGMARSSLADPYLPKKFMEGKYDEIIHCIGCLQGCIGENGKGNCVRCLVNPCTGMEDEYVEKITDNPKNIGIVGGGIAGCEAAIVLARRGHRVTLMEKENELGGQWKLAAVPVNKSEFTSFLYWQKVMLKKYGVNVKLNYTVTIEDLKHNRFDELILANGSSPAFVNIDGLKEYACSAHDILANKLKYGKNVAIIGAGLVGSETADYLSEQGCNVALLEARSDIAVDGEAIAVEHLKNRLAKKHVKIYTSAMIEKVMSDTILFSKNEEKIKIDGLDTIICATGVKSNQAFVQQVQKEFDHVYVIGDAKQARNGYLAIREGYEIGLKL